MDGKYFFGAIWRNQQDIVQRYLLLLASSPRSLLSTSVIDEDSAHHLRSHAEKLRSVLPSGVALRRELHIRFVHQRGRLQRVVGSFVPEAASCDTTQLFVNQWDKLRASFLITGCQLVQ
jgi:hypothetical protein